jgi:tetratricopeptide (TPR) repeat protein
MDYHLASSPELPALNEHPVYSTGMAHIALGQWQQATLAFQLLKDLYPDNAEAKELLEQAHMRAALARSQPKQTSRVKKRLNPRQLFISVVAAIVLAIVAYAGYEVWVFPALTQELRLRQVTSLRQAADEAMVAGDYARARESLRSLQTILPEDGGVIQDLQRIDQVEKSSALYTKAKELMEAGNWDQAIVVLTELQSLDAAYRDLAQLLQIAQESQALEQQFQAAEEAFSRDDWATAIAGYIALQQASLTFRFEDVHARLFESYIRHGQALLEEAGSDPEQVSQAISAFSEALKLRPMDAGALKERNLAETYLAALSSKEQDEVIDLLQMIYGERPDYAGQQAAQLLYTALLVRGDSSLQAGNEPAAIADYQAAAQIAVENPSEAQEKLSNLVSEGNP